MAKTISINWNSSSRGEDSATATFDQLSIPNGYVELLQNIEPSTGRCKPRYGSQKINSEHTNVTWMGEYQAAQGGYALVLDGDVLYSYKIGSVVSKSVIKDDWRISGAKVSSVRIGKYLLLVPDKEGESIVVTEQSGKLVYFKSTISNSFSPISSAYGSKDFTESTAEAMRTGAYNVGCPRMFTHTWIAVDPALRQEDYVDAMPAARIESYEDIGYRQKLNTVETYEVYGDTGSMFGEKSAAEYAYKNVGGFTGIRRFYNSFGDIYLGLQDFGYPPDGATHARIYMTLPAPVTNDDVPGAEAIAAGLAYRWVCDIMVDRLKDPTPYKLPKGDGDLAGATNLVWSTGRDDIPAGGFVKFANGRLFIGGSSTQADAMFENPGRVYYSAIMDGSTDQLSRLLSFAYMTDYVDTSTDESEPCIGAGISQGNLVLFNPASVWVLRDGNPDYAPSQISSMGCVGGITEINQRIFYLSKLGPAAVSGTVVDRFDNFKSDMTTPGLLNFSAFHEQGAVISGFHHNDSWILTDGFQAAAYLMRSNNEGTWRIVPGEEMSFKCHCFPVKGKCWVGGLNLPIYSLMQPDAVRDGATPFLAKMYTNATQIPGGVPCGEAMGISIGATWDDSSQMRLAVIGDYGRVASIYEFEESQETGAATLPAPKQRGPVLQGIQAGAWSHWFQVGVEKYIWGPVMFGPIRLDMIPRNYHPESISVTEFAVPEPILDAGYFGWEPQAEYTEA